MDLIESTAKSGRQPLTTPCSTIALYGGEVPFCMAWIENRLDPQVRDWFRQQAASDPRLRADVESLERPVEVGFCTQTACDLVADALEADNYLVDPRENPNDVEGATSLALSKRPAVVREMVHPGGLDLLVELEIKVPEPQVAEGTRLLNELAAPAVVERFRTLHRSVEVMRERAEQRDPPALARVLLELAARLFERHEQDWRYKVSYRLFLRSRLKRYCWRRGWRPNGPKYHDLETAVAHLSRGRIGKILSDAAADLTGTPPAGVDLSGLCRLLAADC